MGEMADFFLESVYEAEEERGLFRSGEMSNSEAYDKGLIDEAGFEINSMINDFGFETTSNKKVCKKCKENKCKSKRKRK